jgi:hypothetical protein
MGLIEICPQGEGYVRLGRAAELIARHRDDVTTDDVMDAFKRAIFAGELTRDNAGLHMEISVPRCTLPPAVAAMTVIPRALYAVNRSTVASVLMCANALPGERMDWERLLDVGIPNCDLDLPYVTLATIPFRDYPELGRRELEALLVSKSHLSAWLTARRLPLSPNLGDSPSPQDRLAGDSSPALASPAPELRGRPQKPAWPRIVQLVRELQRDHPHWQKKQLAFEAWTLARQEFSEDDLPTIATIQRDMVQILGGGSA